MKCEEVVGLIRAEHNIVVDTIFLLSLCKSSDTEENSATLFWFRILFQVQICSRFGSELVSTPDSHVLPKDDIKGPKVPHHREEGPQ